MSFQIPLHFEDFERTSAGTWCVNTSTIRNQSHDQLLDSIRDDLDQILSSTQSSKHFNIFYYLISQYKKLTVDRRKSLISIIQQLPTLANFSNINHIKISLYFAAGLCNTASAINPPCKYWEKSGLEYTLETAHTLITSIPTSCPFSTEDVDQLSAQIVRIVLQVLEQPTAARDKNLRPVFARCLSAALSLDANQSLPAATALMHALNRYEHLATPLADILSKMLNSGDTEEYKPFVSEFIREVGRLPSDSLARDNTAAKAVSAFISAFAENSPVVAKANMPLLLSHLDGESYVMRNGIVHVIGVLIKNEPQPDDPLLDILLERSHRDIHAFTRSKAMQIWSSLVNAKAVPNKLFPTLAEIAASRLEDKTAAVRKYSAQLMATLLQNNPFGPALRLSHFSAKLKEISPPEEQGEEEENLTNEQDGSGEGNAEQDDETNLDGDQDPEKQQTDQQDELSSESIPNSEESALEAISAEVQSSESLETDQPENPSEESVQKKYYSYAVAFIRAVEKGLETVYKMLRSKSITDVSEAVSLLITSVQFQLEAASGRAVRRMLPLVLARENNIREAVVQAYVRLLAPRGFQSIEDKEMAIVVAKGLISLTVGATTGEIACIEELVGSLSKSSGDSCVISSAVIAVLWDMFAGRIPGATEEQRRAACILVGMVAPHQPESLLQRVSIVEDVGLQSPAFARWSCVALCHLPQTYDQEGHLASKLSNLIKNTSDLSIIDQAISAIYSLSNEPEFIAAELIRELADNLHGNPSAVSVCDLSRFLLVIGHVAVKQLVRNETLGNKLRKSIGNQNRNDGNNDEEEQAAAEAEKALDLAENELVSPSSLLGRYGRLARQIASDMNAPSELQASAVLCTAKLMCVQEKVCKENLRLMFTILSSSKEPVVRSNAVTSLGDLAFRFPNLVEPWSSHIYKSLQDKDDGVRKNTLVSLTHLILNDMIKVKGQIVGLAICILDKNERISELARLFFHELARKAVNAIYNILPDTLSCMSKMDDLSGENFKQVVSFLVGLMDKERHADGMLEKLCHRFRTTESDEENRDLAYCISLLNISERGIRKLSDQFKTYSSAVIDDTVHSYLMQAVAKGNRAGASANCVQMVEELTTKINDARKAAMEDPDTDVRSVTSATNLDQEQVPKPSARTSTRSRGSTKTTRRKRNTIAHEESESDAAEDEEPVINSSEEEDSNTLTENRPRRHRKSKVDEEESESEESNSEDESDGSDE